MKKTQDIKWKPQPKRKTLSELTKELNIEGRLGLFVGAGISMSCGLPSWEELMKRVLDKIWEKETNFATLLMKQQKLHAARYARQKGKDKFNRIVHSAIYQSDDIAISKCLVAIAQSGIKQICNFNFDDLLEEAIIMHANLDLISVSHDENHLTRKDCITVYHPHGILPRFSNEEELDSAKIIFSEDDYHTLYSDPYSWANIIQLSLLMSHSIQIHGHCKNIMPCFFKHYYNNENRNY